jgi:RNA polymerase sigma-70 factor (ECF subfamily)
MSHSALDLRALYAEHYQPLVAYLEKRGSHCAEDVAQETFIRLFDYPNTIHNVRAFLFTTATNLQRDACKGKFRRRMTTAEPSRVRDLVEASLAKRYTSERIVDDRLDKGMRTLTPKERDAIESVYFDGLTQQEAAVKLGIAHRGLRKRLERALAKMRASLEQTA